MQYRVHYCLENDRLMAEVEAASPHEAVVKFRHTHPDADVSQGRRAKILSITPVEAYNEVCYDEPAWAWQGP